MSEHIAEKDAGLIDQTILASDPKRDGNCLSACVASYLGVPLSEVPHFIEHGKAMNGAEDRVGWWAMFLGYMASRGLWAWEIDLGDAEPGEVVFVMGMSPRGVCHQVLYRDGALWHDPHPSRDGVLDVREVLRFTAVTFDHEPTSVTSPGEGR